MPFVVTHAESLVELSDALERTMFAPEVQFYLCCCCELKETSMDCCVVNNNKREGLLTFLFMFIS